MDNATEFTIATVPGVTFTAEHGGEDQPPNWIQVTGRLEDTGAVVAACGFAGP